jgi:hypothetical protein
MKNGIHHPDIAILRTNTVVVIVILVKTIKCNLLDNGKGLNVNTSCCININGIMFAVSVYYNNHSICSQNSYVWMVNTIFFSTSAEYGFIHYQIAVEKLTEMILI